MPRATASNQQHGQIVPVAGPRYDWWMGDNVIERAFQLAPECGSIGELKRNLIREGYFKVEAHLRGQCIRSQISPLLDRGLKHSIPKRA